MDAVLPILLLALAGILAGGAWSSYRQGASPKAIVVIVLLAVVSATAGVFWMLPEGSI
ncbi:hypothetical protein ACWDV4_08835 [Micromonospora sp. NPDC003197]